MLQLATLTPEGLAQSSLADLAEALLALDPDAFRSALVQLDPAALNAQVDEAERAFGWGMPEEVRSYLAVEAALVAAAGAPETGLYFHGAGDRSLQLVLPTVEYLETLPQAGTVLRLGDLTIEILQTVDNSVKTARIRPAPASTLDERSKGAA